MKNSKRPIVVLGGMGPQASVALYRLLIDKATTEHGVDQNEDYPHITVDSLSIPDFISSRDRQNEAIQIMKGAVERASELNPSAVGIACNTAHILVQAIGADRQPTFVSLIDAVTNRVAQSNLGVVGLLASPTTIQTNLYGDSLSKLGIECLSVDERAQVEIEKVIRSVIAGTAGQKETEVLENITSGLISKGARGIILGCTELPLVFDKTRIGYKLFDCLDVLADELLDRYYQESSIESGYTR